ncbi:MAG: hypothetical protein K2X77_01185 [Candidatus Obscuribacterales bacterium]|jgi:hypothetical protein|nr:hypothetical protein [Candidatus Obscuribacterales bacterium]
MYKSQELLLALINDGKEFQAKSTKEEPTKVLKPHDSVFARIAELNKHWQAGLLKSEQTN